MPTFAEPFPEILIEPKILLEVDLDLEEERQVIVHCLFSSPPGEEMLIRIWPTTVLFDPQSGIEAKLIHIENITYFPEWTPIPSGKDYWFTLIFSGLPKSCRQFHLIEKIPQSGGFFVSDIARNQTDVYRIRI